jgi:hypothetical protein
MAKSSIPNGYERSSWPGFKVDSEVENFFKEYCEACAHGCKCIVYYKLKQESSYSNGILQRIKPIKPGKDLVEKVICAGFEKE